MRWCFRACWAETSRSHSRAMADARCGLWWGTVRMSFVGRRRGRLSRWTWRPSVNQNISKIFYEDTWQKQLGIRLRSAPSVCFTCTSFQNLFDFAVPPPVPADTALKSCPFFSSSACFLRLATLESTCSALGIGAVGGGPEAVMGATVAGFGGEVCRHRCENEEGNLVLEELRRALLPSASGNWEIRFMLKSVVLSLVEVDEPARKRTFLQGVFVSAPSPFKRGGIPHGFQNSL
jgi:hypothetical protein